MTAVEFEIRVADAVTPEILALLPGVAMSAQPAGTMLTGSAVDQAAFHGVINWMRGQGLHLVEVRRRPDLEHDDRTDDSRDRTL